MKVPCQWILILSILVLVFYVDGLPGFESESCSSSPGMVFVEPEADVNIGAIIPIHNPGEGLFGCGRPIADGVEVYEAMRWAIGVLNRDSGLLSDVQGTDKSFIPGVKIGMKVYDSCGNDASAVQHLTTLFPVLKSGSKSCGLDVSNSSITLGVIDMSDVSIAPDITEVMRDYFIPSISLSMSTVISAEQIAQVLINLMHDMQWKRIIVIHAEDEYSIHVTKLLTQGTSSNSMCITGLHSFPHIDSSLNMNDIRHFRHVLNLATRKLPDNTTVVIISEGVDSMKMVLQAMAEIPDSVTRLQWLFSWIPPPSALANLRDLVGKSSIFSIAPYPDKVVHLESYWSMLPKSSTLQNLEDRWFLEYLMSRMGCRLSGFMDPSYHTLPMCSELSLIETPLDTLLRTSRAVPALTAIFTLAHAFRKAWEVKCQNVPGICPLLRSMSRREFVDKFLEPVEFLTDENRDDMIFRGRNPRSMSDQPIEGNRLALTKYIFDPVMGVNFSQVKVYDSQGSETLDPKFKSIPSTCPAVGCRGCVRPRQSRLEEAVSINDISLINTKSSDVVIPLLLPIHDTGNTPFECGNIINPEAIQDLEAALWTIDKLNSDPTFLSGIKLGISVIDTCSSPLLTTQKLGAFAMKSDVDISSALAFISADSPEISLAVTSILHSLNITIISPFDITLHQTPESSVLGPEYNHFQISTPVEKTIKAVVDIIDYIGWRFVSMIFENDAPGRKVNEVFLKTARKKGICVGLDLGVSSLSEAEIDHLMEKLLKAKVQGSKVVVLWANDKTTKVILNRLGKFLQIGILNPGDLVILSLGEWGNKPYLVQGLEKEALGSIIIKTQQDDIPEFATHFQRLMPDSNIRNPWFQELWLQEEMRQQMLLLAKCHDEDIQCRTSAKKAINNPIEYQPSISTVNTIQAVITIAAGLARLRNEVCQVELGLCASLLHQSQLRQLISQYILFTSSPRQQNSGHVFKFDFKGYGSTPIEIYNFRKGSTKSYKYHKVGTYENHLTHLANMVTYTSNGEEAMSTVSSECTKDCLKCRSTLVDHMVLPSSDNLYIAATLGVHSSTANPLECGSLQPTYGFQSLEALLWAVDQVNSDFRILPGINLGLIVFDTCGSPEKTAMDVSNFLTGIFPEQDFPSPDHVVGFIADQSDTVVHPVIDVTMPLKITTLSPSLISSEYEDIKKYPYLLRMKMPNNLIISSIISILRHHHWTYISVIYSGEETGTGWNEMFEDFKKLTEQHGIKLALIERLQEKYEDISLSMDVIAHRLKIKQNSGSRVVVLLLSPHFIEELLSAVKRLQKTGRSQVGDFVWLSYDSLEPFQTYPDQSLGALVIQPKSGKVTSFKEYFTSINIFNNSRNPWLKEYWEEVFNCKGNFCLTQIHGDLRQVGFIQHKIVPTIANAFFSIAHGLERLRKSVCVQEFNITHKHCSILKDHILLREKLFQFTKEVNFTGSDGGKVFFGPNNFATGSFDIFNFRNIENGIQAFASVGQYDEASGLFLNISRSRGYSGHGKEVSLLNISSVCNISDTCDPVESILASPLVMEVPSGQEFVLGAFMPVHQPGNNLFTCSQIIDENSFQNLVALSYALNDINSNNTVLPEIKLGALVFDHCGRRQKAEEQIFSFIASDGIVPSGVIGVKPKAVIAAVTFDDKIAEDLSPLFDSMTIPQISTPILTASPVKTIKKSEQRVARSNKMMESNFQVRVIADVLERFNWRYVNVIHDGTDMSRINLWNFFESTKARRICIAESLQISTGMAIPEIAERLFDHLELGDSRVIVMLIDDLFHMKSVLEAAKKAAILEAYIWIVMDNQKESKVIAKILQDSDVDLFLVRTETYDVPGFKEYYSSLSIGKHDPIPDAWFEEFWQHHFHCRLPESHVVQKQYPDVCSGQESLGSKDNLEQDVFVYHTVHIVKTIAEVLHDYLRRYCIHGDAAMNIDDCGNDAREILDREIRKVMNAKSCGEEECRPIPLSLGYQIFQLKHEGDLVYQQVGLWKENQLSLLIEDIHFIGGAKLESVCRLHCRKCHDQLTLDPEELIIPKPPLCINFRTMWGIIVSALSILGMLLVIICAGYFLISFHVTVGTTVLGYMILFGLFLLYAINFSFILTPTEGTCGVRRFALGLSYAIIFSGMLVKVMNIWRMMGFNGNRLLSDGYHLTSPAALLVIAVGLVIIQIILSSAWLILVPPRTGILEREWRCNPPTTFEDELVLSLVYVMLMLAITILFAILTWRSNDNNHESRWIFTCCILVAFVWLIWTVLSTQIRHQYRDLTIIISNLVCATVIMLCMYLRKVYLFNKLTKDEEFKNKVQSTLTVPNMYGTISRHTADLTPISISHCGKPVSENIKICTSSTLSGKLYGSDYSTPSRTALIGTNSDDATSDSSSSVQVQATDLYPLEMYDGGSQFQPASLHLGDSSIILDESLTNYNNR